MRKEMCCPFFIGEIEHHKVRVGIKCEAVEIRFLTKEVRREWVYPLCGDVKGYNECPIFQTLCKNIEEGTKQ